MQKHKIKVSKNVIAGFTALFGVLLLCLVVFLITKPWPPVRAAMAEFEAGTAYLCHGDRKLMIDLDVAKTPRQHAKGLSNIDFISSEYGMLFLFDDLAPWSFWMYQTRMPLDIAFIGDDGLIQEIQTMPPCESDNSMDCPTYSPSQPVRAALEVNAGFFDDSFDTTNNSHSILLSDENCELPIWAIN